MRPLETDKDTICALATAHGLGAISILRVSGPDSETIVRKLAPFLPDSLESHKIYYGMLRGLGSSSGDGPLDEVLISYFQTGRSFTGEASFEISCHGSDVIVEEILRHLILAGARPAERGEFTCRAYMNGRIDLVQAESVLALIESRSTRAAQLALRQLQGGLSVKLKDISERLTKVLAHLEANIDFASEDIEIASSESMLAEMNSVLADAHALLAGYRRGRIIKDGFQIALAGQPNVGKSSLLNALAGEERAIVTEIAGTTRDFVEAQVSEDGLKVTFIDTAGLRKSGDAVEKIGIERSLEKLANVDLVLLVTDASAGPDVAEELSFFRGRIPWEKTALVVNKTDLNREYAVPSGEHLAVLPLSATTGEGLPELRRWLKGRLQSEVSEDSTVLSNARHFRGLQETAASLEKAIPLMLTRQSPDFIALELQGALMALYDVLGLTYDDQVMDKVFSEFCLGK
jgi:tRNA modification GTPase